MNYLVSRRYGKDIVIAETSYPWTLQNGYGAENIVSRVDQLPDGYRFPPTSEGQAAYFEALRSVLMDVPNGHGVGFFASEPEWLPGVGHQPGDGNQYDNLTMFD